MTLKNNMYLFSEKLGVYRLLWELISLLLWEKNNALVLCP